MDDFKILIDLGLLSPPLWIAATGMLFIGLATLWCGRSVCRWVSLQRKKYDEFRDDEDKPLY